MELILLNEKKLSNFAELLNLPGSKLRRIYVISAYYDCDSIKQLIKYMDRNRASGNKSANLELIIVLYKGVRDKEKEYLEKLDKHIREKFCHIDSGIYLASSSRSPGKLFHSKGYLVEGQANGYGLCAVGSLNLTQAGLHDNEELLAVAEGYRIASQSYDSKFARAFKKYVQEIIKNSARRVSEAEETWSRAGSEIQDFFFAGKLYYEASETSPFGFRLELPKKLLKKSRTDISEYLDANASDILDVRKLLDEQDFKHLEQMKKKIEKSHWKSYCLQTCYGYWAPQDEYYIEISKKQGKTIQQAIDKKQKHDYYEEVFRLLEENDKEVFKKLQGECCRLAKLVLKDMQSNPSNDEDKWKFLSDDDQGLNEKKLLQEWSIFRALMKEKNPEFIRRLCGQIESVPMPDIWKDPSAIKNFKDSFDESFRYESEKRNSRNKLLKLLEQYGATGGSGWKEAIIKLLDQRNS